MHHFFEKIAEIIGWFFIVASPLTLSLLVAAFIYFSNPSILRLIIAILVILLGIIIGIIWATKVYKSKRGTVGFLSRVNTPPQNEEVANKN